MKAENDTTGHNRTIKLTGLPGELSELYINLMYVYGPNDPYTVDKAITLDSIVIPEIIRCLNKEHIKPCELRVIKGSQSLLIYKYDVLKNVVFSYLQGGLYKVNFKLAKMECLMYARKITDQEFDMWDNPPGGKKIRVSRV